MLSIYSRYHGLTQLSIDEKISISHRTVPKLDYLSGAIRHTIVGYETLDQLAIRYYGREELWWRIAAANPNRPLTDWRPGDVVIIPPRHIATRTLRG